MFHNVLLDFFYRLQNFVGDLPFKFRGLIRWSTELDRLAWNNKLFVTENIKALGLSILL